MSGRSDCRFLNSCKQPRPGLFLFLIGYTLVYMELPINIETIRKLDIPDSPGCYFYRDKGGKIIYIGKAVSLKSRVRSYWQPSASHNGAKLKMLSEVAKVSWTTVESEIEALLLEANLIKKHRPYYNILLRDDKRHNYIKVSIEDELPGIFATRKITKSGIYFGPFTKGMAVKETVKALRKIWPYCTEKKLKQKPCFYYQIGRCTGVCGGKTTIKEYKERVIKPIVLFLEGKKEKVIKNIEKQITALESAGKYEEAHSLSFTLRNMKMVLEHTRVLGVSEKYENDVYELAKLLSLPSIPLRIEGYDISNIFGNEATGSMVVFSEGEPDSPQYRKFKISATTVPRGDTEMLKELLDRRFKHSQSKNLTAKNIETPSAPSDKENPEPKVEPAWPLPDLIVIDGAKAQLNTAVKALKKAGLSLPVVAISKGDGLRSARARDKLLFPGENKPLELPLASPALHLIKRVRDEAHRFAIGYHRVLRKKRTYS